MRTSFKYFSSNSNESGQTLMEILIALAILSVVGVTFIAGVTNTSKQSYIADEQATSESLARSQMEWVKRLEYSSNGTGYPAEPIPLTSDYLNYTANITALPLHNPDEGIQKITISIFHSDKPIFSLEDYKVDR
jgi:prepilin-type N-terminal cleavage/methylation domain-containing protein